jgi:putative ABC transport system permease protein
VLRPRDLLHEAVYGLVDRPVRSLLTALGVVFGVAAVIAMMAIGEGGRRQTEKLAESLGLTRIIVTNRDFEPDDPIQEEAERSSQGLRLLDGAYIASISEDIRGFGGRRDTNATEVVPRVGDEPPPVIGVDASYLDHAGLETVHGRLFDEQEHARGEARVVLGYGAARMLFGREAPLGKHIRADGVWLEVVGVVRQRIAGGSAISGFEMADRNREIYIPLQTALKRFRVRNSEPELHELELHVSDESLVLPMAELIDRSMLRLHGNVRDFELEVPLEKIQQNRSTQRIFNLVMVLIASISLLVGGIGIMNVMLSSVLERTAEIGVRRAVGATRANITRQFLGEAALVSLLGGIAGTVLGYGSSLVVRRLTEWPTAVSAESVLVAVGISVAVGVVFGWWPARRAAKLSPVVALRHD